MKLGREVIESLRLHFVARTGKSTISDHLTPTADDTVNLGTPSYRWDTIYVRNLVADDLTGAGGNADMVDGFHAYATPNADALLALDASSKFPATAIRLGTGITVSGTDLVLAWSGTPSTIQPDDAAAGGSSLYAARTDHKHAIICEAPTGSLADDTTNQEGSATTFARSDHLHAISASSNPGANAELLKTAADGGIQLARLGIGTDPAYDNWLQLVANGQVGVYGGPNLLFDNANSELEVRFGANQRATFYDEGGLFISPTHTQSNIHGFKYYANGDLSSPTTRNAIDALLQHDAGVTATTLRGIETKVYSGPNTGASISTAIGAASVVSGTGGDITNAYAGYFNVTNSSASSLIGTAYGVQININESSGTITTGYGLKIEDVIASTTAYSIYTGTGKISLGAGIELRGSPAEITTLSNADLEIKPQGTGKVSIGAASPQCILDIFDDSTQLRLTYQSDTSKHAEFTVGSTGTVELDAIANIVLDPDGNNVNPGGSIEDDLGAYNFKWRTLYAAELYVENLVAQDVMATIGGRIMVAPTTKLDEDLDTTETGVDVEDASFLAVNDYIYLCAAPGDPPVPQVEVMQITGIASNTLTVVRNKDGSGANNWLIGDAVVNLGYAAGEGYLELTSTQTIHSHLGPTIAIYSRTGTANWNDINPIVALGNLDSFLGMGGNEYGLAIGNDLELSSPSSADFKGATLTRAGGLKLYNTDLLLYDVSTPKVQIKHNEGILMSSGTWSTDTTTFAAVFADDGTVTDLDAGDVIIGTPFHATPASQIGIHWDDSIGTLKIKGSVLIGNAYGCVIPDAVLYCPYDGPWPYNVDFQVNTHGHLGQIASLSGSVIGRVGNFGKAVQVAEATTNELLNPSWETSTSNWTKSAGLSTYSRIATFHYIGDYAAEMYENAAAGTDEYIYSSSITAAVSEVWAFSIYIYKTAGNSSSTGRIQLQWLDSGSGHLGYDTQVLDAGSHGWKRYQVIGTAPASTAYVRAIVSMEGVVVTTSLDLILDATQLEEKAYSTPYCDGSLGIGHSWNGTAHASSSSRTAGQITYGDVPIAQNGSISCWVYSTAKISDSGNKRVILSAYDSTGVALYIETDDKLTSKIAGSVRVYQLNDTNFPADEWHQIVVVWGPNEWTIYLDSVQVYQAAAAPNAFDDAGGYDIGHEGGSYQWPGFIDDLIVTERCLTAVEVATLYESQLPAYVRTNRFELMLTDTGHGKILGHADGLFGYDSAGNEAFALVAGGVTWGSKSLSEGDLVLGDPDGDAYLFYDCSEQKLFVQGGIYIGDFSGCVINNAVFYLPYDGPRPHETDFQVNTTGHLGQGATFSGGVIGRPGKYDKAVQTAEATENKLNDPSFGNATIGTYWNSILTAGISRITTDGYVGNHCCKLDFTTTANSGIMHDAIQDPEFSNDKVAIQGRVKAYNVTAIGKTTCYLTLRLHYTDASNEDSTTYFDALTYDWQIKTVMAVINAGKTLDYAALYVRDNSINAYSVYLDACQMEDKDYCTPYADGTMSSGHSWSGTAHASKSIRIGARLQYENASVPDTGSFCCWAMTSAKMSNNNNSRYIFDYGGLSGARLIIATTDYLNAYIGSSSLDAIQLTDSNFAPFSWHHIAFTWDKNNDEFKVYLDGIQQGSDGNYGTWNPSYSDLNVGSGLTGNYPFPGWFDDYIVLDYILTENDIRRIYENGASVIVPTNKFELMLTAAGYGKVIGHASGIFGYDAVGNEAFALATSVVTWGGQSVAAGDLILGDPDNNAHLFYDASAGQLLFRDSSKATQVYIDTDGSLNACGGDIILSDGNLTLWDRSSAAGGTPYVDFYYDKDPGSARIAFVTGDYGGTDAVLWLESVKYTGAPWTYCSTIVAAFDNPSSTSVRLTVRSDKTAKFTTVDTLSTDGDFVFEGDLRSYKNAAGYTVYGAQFYTEPKTNASWNGDTKTAGSYDIDTSTWGVPAGVKAVYVRFTGYWSAASNSYWAGCKRKGGTSNLLHIRSKVANINDDEVGWVPCDSNGDFTVTVSGASVLGTHLQIWGFMI